MDGIDGGMDLGLGTGLNHAGGAGGPQQPPPHRGHNSHHARAPQHYQQQKQQLSGLASGPASPQEDLITGKLHPQHAQQEEGGEALSGPAAAAGARADTVDGQPFSLQGGWPFMQGAQMGPANTMNPMLQPGSMLGGLGAFQPPAPTARQDPGGPAPAPSATAGRGQEGMGQQQGAADAAPQQQQQQPGAGSIGGGGGGEPDPSSVVVGMPLAEFAQQWQLMAQQQQASMYWCWQMWASQMMQAWAGAGMQDHMQVRVCVCVHVCVCACVCVCVFAHVCQYHDMYASVSWPHPPLALSMHVHTHAHTHTADVPGGHGYARGGHAWYENATHIHNVKIM